jgi:hypothetical protein
LSASASTSVTCHSTQERRGKGGTSPETFVRETSAHSIGEARTTRSNSREEGESDVLFVVRVKMGEEEEEEEEEFVELMDSTFVEV